MYTKILWQAGAVMITASHNVENYHLKFRMMKLWIYKGLLISHDFAALYRKMFNSRLEICNEKTTFSVSFVFNHLTGGGNSENKSRKKRTWSIAELKQYTSDLLEDRQYEWVGYVPTDCEKNSQLLYIDIPKDILLMRLNAKQMHHICNVHGIYTNIKKYVSLADYKKLYQEHQCEIHACDSFISVFSIKKGPMPKTAAEHMVKLRQNNIDYKLRDQNRPRREHPFPPAPPSDDLLASIITDYCDDIKFENLQEKGCAVCGQLKSIKELESLQTTKADLDLLEYENENVTRLLRTSKSDSSTYLKGPILDTKCSDICFSCRDSLQAQTLPTESLANGLWLGPVPPELQDLSWTEKLMISRVIHNYCTIRVASSGMHKLKANAVCHSIPTPKIYKELPPPREDMDEVITFLFIGPTPPTPEDFKRTPFLARKNKVAKALEWLKLNHIDYLDIDISYDNLNQYDEHKPPVYIHYEKSKKDETKVAEATAVNTGTGTKQEAPTKVTKNQKKNGEGPTPGSERGIYNYFSTTS